MKERLLLIFKTFLLINLCLCFTNCKKKDNEGLFQQFENEFRKSVEESIVKTFDYSYDGLVPQSSFFINSKLKYLKYKHSPENGTVESFVYFDLETDSIRKIIRRKILFEWDDETNQQTENFTDTLYVVLFDKKKIYTYVNNQIVDSSFNKSTFNYDKDFIKRIKIETEKNYFRN
ncbi:hypothetical protein [Flavobacterium sp.]|uniref:hypothetical protein n=1 Tax=Flavobacterium sp. TaxID=239 RepID=UPI0039E5551B